MSSKRSKLSRTRAAMTARLAAPPARVDVPAVLQSGPDGLRVRAAEAADLPDFRRLCGMAEVDVENTIAEAIQGGYAGQALQIGLTSGVEAFFDDIMARFDTMSTSALKSLFLRLTLALVAERDDAGVVGAALAFPPVGTIMHQLEQLRSLGAPQETQTQLTLAGALRVSRIKAVGVREDARRSGAGAALVNTCTTAFTDLGYSIVYGIMPPRPGLETFYSGLGFTILSAGKPYRFKAAGLPTAVQADPDERIFYRQTH